MDAPSQDWGPETQVSPGACRSYGADGRALRVRAHMSEVLAPGRPGPAWSVVTTAISGSVLTVESRRMCYPEREVIAALHVLDARPMPLVGTVASCEYTGDGMHKVVVTLAAYQSVPVLERWLEEMGRDYQRSIKKLRG
jgi:hypothetical protein